MSSPWVASVGQDPNSAVPDAHFGRLMPLFDNSVQAPVLTKAEGRFGKQDFRCVADQDVYICPAGERLAYSFTTEDKGLVLRRYATKACPDKRTMLLVNGAPSRHLESHGSFFAAATLVTGRLLKRIRGRAEA
jgi:hypothetical protein